MPGEVVPQEYHWALMTEEERRDAARDLGVALETAARRWHADPELARLAATQALPLLEAAVRDLPDDLSAGESLGYVLGVLGRPGDALARIRTGSSASNRVASGPSLTRLSRCWPASNGSIWRAAMQKTIAVSPWRSDYRLGVGQGLLPGRGLGRGRRGLPRSDPDRPRVVEARSLLVQCYLQSHEPDRADAELQDPAPLLPRQPRGVAAVVRAAETRGASGRG